MSNEEFKVDIDEKQLAKEAPLFVRGQAEKLLKQIEDAINTADFNKDGKADVGQVAAIVFKAMPLLAAANDCVDFEKMAEHAVKLPFFKDEAKARDLIVKLAALAEESQALMPKQS